jgi:radical SAM protein with 4Fe4S-binding SPASM domain
VKPDHQPSRSGQGGTSPSPYVVKRRLGEVNLWHGKSRLLSKLDMELTERCNNNCIHCCINLPAGDRAARARELTTQQVTVILEEASTLGCMSVRFTGGEPLLRDDFEGLYLHARRLGLAVTLFTNATLLTPHLADLLARVPPRSRIEITVYGMERSSYEAVTRVPGSFEAAWQGIRLLQERQVPFVVKGAILPPNRDELGRFEDWAATIPWMDGRPPSYSMFFDLRCRRDSDHKNRLIRKLRLSPQDGLRIVTRDPERYLHTMRQFCAKFMGPGGDRLFTCGAGHAVCVDAYGVFQPCIMLRHPDTVCSLVGVQHAAPLRDALITFFPQVREIRATNPDYLARCAQCFLKGLCEQCPAKSWTEHGTLDTPVEYLCDVAHAQARYLGLLAADERAWEVTDWRQRIARFTERET